MSDEHTQIDFTLLLGSAAFEAKIQQLGAQLRKLEEQAANIGSKMFGESDQTLKKKLGTIADGPLQAQLSDATRKFGESMDRTVRETLLSTFRNMSFGELTKKIGAATADGLKDIDKALQQRLARTKFNALTTGVVDERGLPKVSGSDVAKFGQDQSLIDLAKARATQLAVIAQGRAAAEREAAAEVKAIDKSVFDASVINIRRKRAELITAEKEALALAREAAAEKKAVDKSYYDASVINIRKQRAELREQAREAKAVAAAQKDPSASYGQHLQDRLTALRADGGAGLFAIQATLLKNYLLINQVFNLISFGTRFVFELDEAFHQLQAISASTEGTMVGLRDRIMEVGTQTKFSAVEVAKAAVIMAQAGFSEKQISEAIGPITLFATAVGSDLTSAVDLVTSTMAIFNMRADETENVVNVMTGALNKSKLTVEKLSLGLQYAGNTAADAGIGFTELTTVLAALSNQGIRSGSTMGTGLRQVIVDLLDPTPKLTKELNKVGLTLEDVNVRSRGLIPVLKTMKEAGFGVESAFRGMEIRGAAAYAAISSQASGLDLLQQQLLLTKAASEANEIQSKSMTNTFSRFAATGGAFIDNITKPMQALAVIAAQSLNGLLRFFNENAKVTRILGAALLAFPVAAVFVGFGRLIFQLGRMSLGFTGVAAASTTAMATVETGAVAATVATTRLGGAMRLLTVTNVIGAIVGVGLAIAEWVGAFDSASDAVDSLKTKLEESQGEYDKVSQQVETVDDKIKELNSRYADINGNAEELQTQTTEVRLRFAELGLELPPLVTGVDQLTGALAGLRNKLSEIASINLGGVILDLQNLISLQSRQALAGILAIPDIGGIGMNTLPGGPSDEMGGAQLGSGQRTGVLPSGLQSQLNSILTGVRTHGAGAVAAQGAGDLEMMRTEATAAANGLLKMQTMLHEFSKSVGEGSDAAKAADALSAQLGAQRDAYAMNLASSIVSLQGKLIQKSVDDFEKTPMAEALRASTVGFLASHSDTITKTTYGAKGNYGLLIEERRKVQNELDADTARMKDLMATNPEVAKVEAAAPSYQKWKEEHLRVIGNFDNMIEDQTKIMKGIDQNLEDTADLNLNKWKLDRDNLTQGSPEWKDLNHKMATALTDKLNRSLAPLQADYDAATDTGMKDSIKAKMQAMREDTDSKIRDLWDITKKGSVPAAASELAGLLVEMFEDWKNAIAEGKAKLEDKLSNAQWGLKEFDLSLQAAKDSGKYASTDIDYAKEVTRKPLRVAGLQTEVAAKKEYLDLVHRENAAALANTIVQRDAALAHSKSALLQKDQNKYLSEYRRLSGEVRTMTKEESDATRDLAESTIELNGVLGNLNLQQQSVATTLRFALDQYLKANQGNLSAVDYFKSQLPEVVGTAGGALSKFFKDIASGTVSAADAFRSMASSIIESLLDIAAQYAAMQIFKAILGLIGGSVGGSPGLYGGVDTIGSTGSPGLYAGIGKVAGGLIGPAASAGRYIGGRGRDSVLTPTEPGEFVVRKAAVDTLGLDTLSRINALGNRTVSGSSPPRFSGHEQRKPDLTNIYIIPPDQKPGMTKNDILINMQEALTTNGTTKQLVRQIARS